MNGSKALGGNLKLLAMTAALCGGLIGCDGGTYDATTGRYVPGAGSRPLPASEMSAPTSLAPAAQPSNPCHRPENAAPVALDQAAAAAYAAAGDARYGYAPSTPAPSGPAPATAGEVDAFSRTPPPAVAQPDGTPAKPAIARVSPEAGSADGGEELLITGSGFGAVQVLVGNVPARVTSQSSNAVTVIVPPGRSGPTSVVVTNRDGSYVALGGAYRYM
ncbi:MAG TPA: IPT/TIG domain-containing protein [Anaeromyxobacteraceae bacterium]|nr:IPT/TIG domain-containing protein [Anaeromyxobacteraceae bacterium]